MWAIPSTAPTSVAQMRGNTSPKATHTSSSMNNNGGYGRLHLFLPLSHTHTHTHTYTHTHTHTHTHHPHSLKMNSSSSSLKILSSTVINQCNRENITCTCECECVSVCVCVCVWSCDQNARHTHESSEGMSSTGVSCCDCDIRTNLWWESPILRWIPCVCHAHVRPILTSSAAYSFPAVPMSHFPQLTHNSVLSIIHKPGSRH